jgi:hypothetical protein
MPANRRKVGATAPYDRWELLGKLLDARRRELGYTWRAPLFERDRDVNRRMAADLEKAAPKRVNHFTEGTLRHSARGYRVTYGSVLAVLRGERDDLVPAPDVPPDEDTPPMTPERTAATRPWFDEINERRVALAAQGVTNPSGEQMFGEGTADAKAWDDHGYWSVGDRVWFIAAVRQLSASWVPNSDTGATSA